MTTLFEALSRRTPSNVGTRRPARAASSAPALRSPRHAGSSARQSGPPDIELRAARQIDLARVRSEIRASVIRDGSGAARAAAPAAPLLLGEAEPPPRSSRSLFIPGPGLICPAPCWLGHGAYLRGKWTLVPSTTHDEPFGPMSGSYAAESSLVRMVRMIRLRVVTWWDERGVGS